MCAKTLQSQKISRRHGRVCTFLVLCALALIVLLSLPCRGIGIGYAQPRISAAANNEPLYQLLAKISKATGYRIEITKGWKDKPVTADLKKVFLEEGMKTIIRALGPSNHALIVDEDGKKIEIRIFDELPAGRKGAGNVDVVCGDAGHDVGIFPPDHGRSGPPSDMDFSRQLPPRPDLGIEYPY